jgi:hypothetical protein
MCLSCAVFDHAGHSVVPVGEGRQLECEQVKESIELIEGKLEVASVGLMDLQGLLLGLDGKKVNIIDTVERMFSGLEDALSKRESHVLASIDAQYDGKVATLHSQLQSVKKRLEAREEAISTIESIAQLENPCQVGHCAWRCCGGDNMANKC